MKKKFKFFSFCQVKFTQEKVDEREREDEGRDTTDTYILLMWDSWVCVWIRFNVIKDFAFESHFVSGQNYHFSRRRRLRLRLRLRLRVRLRQFCLQYFFTIRLISIVLCALLRFPPWTVVRHFAVHRTLSECCRICAFLESMDDDLCQRII